MKVRLDRLLVERDLFSSRAKASEAISAGSVLLGVDRRLALKSSQLVESDAEVNVGQIATLVSRAGTKLANALDATKIDPAGRVCLDVGASTGGFTDCLLQRGASHVTAIDVGHNLLDPKLRSDPRLTVLEGVNARALTPEQIKQTPDLITIDVSFISLGKVLEPVLNCAAQTFDCLALVKPQFEVGPGRVSKAGVVLDPDLRRQAIKKTADTVIALGFSVMGLVSSGLPGPAGNRETFIWIGQPGRPEAVSSISFEGLEL